jgi:hypothetical protein
MGGSILSKSARQSPPPDLGQFADPEPVYSPADLHLGMRAITGLALEDPGAPLPEHELPGLPHRSHLPRGGLPAVTLACAAQLGPWRRVLA